MNYFKKIGLFAILGLCFLACSSEDDPYNNGNPSPSPSNDANIAFQEVRFNQNDRIELVNLGSSTVDVSTWWLCSRFSYAQLNTLSLEEGSLNLAAGDSLILSGFNLNDTEADLGLFTGNTFTSSEAIVDFLQWGNSGIGRESVAVQAGIWTAGDFIQGVAQGSSIVYDGSGDAASDYVENPNPSLGDDTTSTSPGLNANVRLIRVDTEQEVVELKNFGPGAMDISNYQLCLGPGQYNILSDYTSITGDLDLASEETVVITLSSGTQNVTALPDANGALGLFANDSFGSNSPDDLRDFVQWGAASQNRVDQAVAAGRWGSATEFVPGASPYTFVGDTSNTGIEQWIDDTVIRMVSINTANDEVTLKNFDQVTRDLSNYFFCTLAGVYPQLGNAAEVQIVTGDLTLSPDEEVTVKVLTNGGVVDANGSIFLFSSNALGFNNQNAAVTRDFAQWQAGNGFRVDNAVTTGRWDAVASFIPGDSPYTFNGNAAEVGASFWSGTVNPPLNSLVVLKEVRFNQSDRIEIQNLNSSAIDISSWWFCSRFAYSQLSGLSVESGSLNIPAGGSVILSGFAMDDTSADLGLYTTNSFGSPAAMIDFVQWGGGDIGRASVAVSAGIWPSSGEFVDVSGAATGASIEFDGAGNTAADWAVNASPSL